VLVTCRAVQYVQIPMPLRMTVQPSIISPRYCINCKTDVMDPDIPLLYIYG